MQTVYGKESDQKNGQELAKTMCVCKVAESEILIKAKVKCRKISIKLAQVNLNSQQMAAAKKPESCVTFVHEFSILKSTLKSKYSARRKCLSYLHAGYLDELF